jgi:hypothetical protein
MIYLSVFFVFILMYLTPLLILKGIHREAVNFPIFFWFAVASTGLITIHVL